MFVTEIDLGIDYETIGLPVPKKAPSFTGYILKNYDEYCKDRRRPAVLVLPGGGYGFTSQREATPVALEFAAAGISAFILRYSVAPDAYYPTELIQALQAIRIIREHADEWHIDPDKIAVCGFSAGGHLAASTGVFWKHGPGEAHGFAGEAFKPNGLILAYPVISSGEKGHKGSFINLLGDQYNEELLEKNSLEKQVTKDTPKSFIWHTFEDNGVPVQNALYFASALVENGVSVELHVYPHGGHGLSLANSLVCTDENVIQKIQTWIPLAKEWVYGI